MKRLLVPLIGVGGIVALIAFIYPNVTMNFTILGFVYLFLSVLAWLIFRNFNSYTPFDDKVREATGVMFVSVAVLFACWTLRNYFFAVNDIYSNCEHHAVRIDGVNLLKPQKFVVAGNTNSAFFDNQKFQGRLSIKDYDDKFVVLKADGFTQAVYLEKYGAQEKHIKSEVLNEKSLIPIEGTDKIRLINSRDTCELSCLYDVQSHFFGSDEVNCNYMYRHAMATDTVSLDLVIRKGLSLKKVYGEIISDFNLEGLNVLRQTFFTEAEDADYYIDKPFVLELNAEVFENATFKSIQVVSANGQTKTYSLNSLKNKKSEIVVPFNKPFSIGCIAGKKTVPVRFVHNKNGVTLEYVTPHYHQLGSLNTKGSNNLFVTTSLSREIIEKSNPPENIMLFDFFDNEDNANNFKRPLYLSYVSGPTTQELQFLVNGSQVLKVGDLLPNVLSKDGRLTWNISVENFKESAGSINENYVILFIIILGVCLLFCISAGRVLPVAEGNGGFKYFTILELMAYFSVLLIFSFRLFLQWRAFTFPPVELASVYELNHFFRNEEGVIWQFVGLNFFLQTILIIKRLLNNGGVSFMQAAVADLMCICIPMLVLVGAEVYLFHIQSIVWICFLALEPFILYIVLSLLYHYIFKSDRLVIGFQNLWDGLTEHCPRFWWLWVILFFVVMGVLVFALTEILTDAGGGQLTKILVPVGFYFVLEYFIWRSFPPIERGNEYAETIRGEGFNILEIFSMGLGFSFLNGLISTAILVKLDGGYGIMFLSFFMFVTIVKLYDFIRSYSDNGNNPEHPYKSLFFGVIIPLALVLACVLFFIFYKDILAAMALHSYVACVIPFIFVLLVLAVVVLQLIFGIHLFSNAKSTLTTLVSVLVLSLACVCVVKDGVLTKHTLQRVMVHVASAEQGLEQTETAQDERRFFDASINDYVLHVYNKQADEVDAIGGGGSTYFKMQDHSRVGAMFGAQTSDILTARFIIAEHGHWLPVLFIATFLAMIFFGVAMKTRYRVSKMLLIQIPGLLFFHSLFVWLANTQMFIFLGQDFPLLSLNSKLAVMYYFILLAVWVGVAVVEKINYLTAWGEPDHRDYYYTFIGALYSFVLVVMVGIFFFTDPGTNANYKNKKLDLEELVRNTRQKVDNINSMFMDYQDSIHYKSTNLGDVSKVIAGFHKQYEPAITAILGGESSFYYRLWDKFAVKGGAKTNSSSALIHARRKRGYLVLSVKEGYFDKNLPVVNDSKWRGSIIASSDQDKTLKQVSQNGDYRQYILPEEWTHAEKNVVVLKKLGKREEVIRTDNQSHANFKMNKSGYMSTCRRFPDDIFHSDHLEELSVDTYFARNVMINGQRSFIYPMSEKFFWAHIFAEELRHQKGNNEMLAQSGMFHKNVEITIDRQLTADIYDYMGSQLVQQKCYMSAIVADGNGQIRAMVDRKKNFVLNPNNRKEMSKLSDELYMDEDPQKSDAYFGNMNLLTLKDGPGSSQKPLVWTAVASGINYDWRNLKMYKFNTKIDGKEFNNGPLRGAGKDFKYYTIRSFGGERLYLDINKKIYKALSSDENHGRGVDLEDFMHHSSNFYNTLMLYIGSYPSTPDMHSTSQVDESAMFAKIDRKKIFSPKGSVYRERYDSVFPLLTQGNGHLYKLNRKLSRDYDNSLLIERLNLMFGFNGEEKVQLVYEGNNLSAAYDDRLSNYAFAATPRFSYIPSEVKYDRGYLREALHQAAVGGASVWNVSPYSMAQNFGQLVMLNKNYKLTLNPAVAKESKYGPFTDLSEGFKEARPAFLLGMNKVFDASGTLVSFKPDKEGEVSKLDGYYLYGKTGTSNESGSKHTNLHRLGVVITDQPIHKLSQKQLKDVKYYVFYFTSRYPNGPAYKNIIKKVIASDDFKNYMKSENKKEK